MSTLVPPPIRTPIELPNGAMHPVWERWFLSLFQRVGGAVSGDSSDVELRAALAQAFDSSSIDSQLASLAQSMPLPRDTSALEARIAELEYRLRTVPSLHDQGYSEDWHDFVPQASPPYRKGRVYYDFNDNTLNYYGEFEGTSLNIGQENWIRVRNQSGATILNGRVVKIVGATGQTPLVQLARADADDVDTVIAFTTMDIPNNGFGVVTSFGIVRDIDTSAFSDGDVAYLSASTAGVLTTTKPTAPNHSVKVGTILFANPATGRIHVDIESAEDLTAHELLTTAHGLNGGTYTPTLTNTANVTASTAIQCQWSRVNNIITVSGKVTVQPTLTATATQLGISLPVASNFGAQEDCSGTAAASGIASQCAAIRGDTTNDRAEMVWISTDITSQPMYFIFQYEVI